MAKRKDVLGPIAATPKIGEDFLGTVFRDAPVAPDAPVQARENNSVVDATDGRVEQPTPESKIETLPALADEPREPAIPATTGRRPGRPRKDGTKKVSEVADRIGKYFTLPAETVKRMKFYVVEHPEHSESSLASVAIARFLDDEEGK
jgi:hypothetical protein